MKENLQLDQPADLLCYLLNPRHTAGQIQAALQPLTDLDWSELLNVTGAQGVTSILSHILQPLIPQLHMPLIIQNRLQQSTLQIAARNVRMLHEAGEILSALTHKGLDVIVLKGLYLIEAVYSNISLRQFSDLDLMIKRSDVDTAISCLCDLGYSIITYFSSNDANQDIKHVPPMSKPNGPFVELHWTILEENEPFIISTDDMWTRAIHANIAGVDVLALGIEDLLLHLCTHLGYQHHLHLGLRGLYDLVAVLERFGEQVDWQLLVRIARQWGAERVVCLVLTMAKTMLGANVPDKIFNLLLQEHLSETLISVARMQLLEGKQRRAGMTPDLAKLEKTRGFTGKIIIIMQRIFIPKRSLARLYNISPKSPLIYGYYLKRLHDLIRFYGQKPKRFLSPDSSYQEKLVNERVMENMRDWMSNKADFE